MANFNWYNLTIEQVLSKANELFGTSLNGLKSDDINNLREKFGYGYNELVESKKKGLWFQIKLFFGQLNSLLIYILIFAAVLSFFLGKIYEPIAILVIVLLAAILGFIQEYSAEKAIENLKKLAAPITTVFRDGIEMQIPSRELIPGDIVVIKAGDRIPADGRLIEAVNLKIDEASFTGESLPVEKFVSEIPGEVSLADMKNSVFAGTTALYGRGKAIVTEIGMNTHFGKIAAKLLETDEGKTPLQRNINQLGQKLGIFAITIAILVGLSEIVFTHPENFVWQEKWIEITLFVIALAVAIVPEALPAVVTITLATSVTRMSKRNALIRKLPAVETLGATQVICSDKTGTLTKNEMTVKKIFFNNALYNLEGLGYEPVGKILLDNKIIEPGSDKELERFFIYSSLCNDSTLSFIDNIWKITGDPTEAALIVASKKYGVDFDKLREKYPRIYEIPFTSESKRMTTVHKFENKIIAIGKGAQEIILNSCNSIFMNGKVVELTENIKNEILNITKSFAKDALRILAISYKELDNDNSFGDEIERDMTFMGFLGMIDPPREEVKDAIRVCKEAQIVPVMITGDHKDTAVAIAKELKIYDPENHLAVSGVEFENLDDKYLEENIEKYRVFARISPFHKLKIVETLQKKGKIVAMTGDGINDAPSLKKADIGVAMGITGTDVSKEAADMILTDDNFASIVAAVEEGRIIFDNIRKYLVYLLSGNLGTVLALTLAILAGYYQPLSAVQILFINFVMDGLMAIALSNEPAEGIVMKRAPRKVKEGILHKKSLTNTAVISILIGLTSFGVFIFYHKYFNDIEAGLVFFISLILMRVFNGITCKSLDDFKLLDLSNNISLIISAIITLALTSIIVFYPYLYKIFGINSTIKMNLNIILISITAAIIFWILAEGFKWLWWKKLKKEDL